MFFDPFQWRLLFKAGNAMSQPRKHFYFRSVLEQVIIKSNMQEDWTPWDKHEASPASSMLLSSQRAEKGLERRDKLSGGSQSPHLHITELLDLPWQRVDSTKTLGTSEDARSEAPPAYRLKTTHEIWKPHRRLDTFFTNHSGNILVHFCMIYKKIQRQAACVCYVRRL